MTEKHTHYWVIESANNNSRHWLEGYCKICGEVKKFPKIKVQGG